MFYVQPDESPVQKQKKKKNENMLVFVLPLVLISLFFSCGIQRQFACACIFCELQGIITYSTAN